MPEDGGQHRQPGLHVGSLGYVDMAAVLAAGLQEVLHRAHAVVQLAAPRLVARIADVPNVVDVRWTD